MRRCLPADFRDIQVDFALILLLWNVLMVKVTALCHCAVIGFSFWGILVFYRYRQSLSAALYFPVLTVDVDCPFFVVGAYLSCIFIV